MVPQPEDEKVAIMCGGKSYKLMRRSPGQRFGLVEDIMQPTLMKMDKLYLTLHVDDLLMVGRRALIDGFISFLESKG